MAGQGSINTYQAPTPAIQGIAAALQAIQSYYGIDTAKAQQKLLGVQTEAEQGKVDEAKKLSSELDAMQAGGAPGVRAAEKLGLSYMPAPGAKKAVVPTAADQPVSPLSAAIQGVNAGEAAGTGSSPLAVNDVTTSDAPQSALGGSIKTISQATRPQSGASSRKAVEVDSAGVPAYTRGTVTDANGNVQGYWVDTKQQAADLANQKTRGEIAKNAEELHEMPQKQKNEAITAFNTEAKPYKDAIMTGNSLQKALTSGNKISENLAQMKASLEVLGVKRVGEQMLGASEGQDLLSQIEDFKEKSSTGHPSADNLDTLNKAVQTYVKSAEESLIDVASTHGKQMESVLGVPADKAVSKYLLPNGTGAKYIQTSVRQLPNNERELVIADKDGQWQSVPHNQAEAHYSPLMKSILATGAANKAVFQSLLGRAGKFLGGGGE